MSRARSFPAALCLAASLAATALAGCATEEDEEPVAELTTIGPATDLMHKVAQDERVLPPGIETTLWASARCVKDRVVVTASQRVDLDGGDEPVLRAGSAVATLRVGERRQVIELRGGGHLTVAGSTPAYLLYLFSGSDAIDGTDRLPCDALTGATLQVDLLMKDGETVCRIEGPARQPRQVECSR